VEAATVTITPLHLNEYIQRCRGISKLKQLKILGRDKEQENHQVIAHISTETKKQRVFEQVMSEVLEKIRSTK
jgi:cytochrome c2